MDLVWTHYGVTPNSLRFHSFPISIFHLASKYFQGQIHFGILNVVQSFLILIGRDGMFRKHPSTTVVFICCRIKEDLTSR